MLEYQNLFLIKKDGVLLNTVPIMISLLVAVYIPLYWSFTPNWREMIRSRVEMIEGTEKKGKEKITGLTKIYFTDLDKLSYFLTNPNGIPIYLRQVSVIIVYFLLTKSFRFLHSEFSAELLYLWQDITEYFKMDDDREQQAKYNKNNK